MSIQIGQYKIVVSNLVKGVRVVHGLNLPRNLKAPAPPAESGYLLKLGDHISPLLTVGDDLYPIFELKIKDLTHSLLEWLARPREAANRGSLYSHYGEKDISGA